MLPSLQRHPAGFWFWHLVLPLGIGLFLWFIYPQTGIDPLIESWYYDPAAHLFPLRNAPWLTSGMHTGLKMTAIGLEIIVFGAWGFSFLEPSLQPERRRMGWMWLAMLFASLTISALKGSSIHHCPWDIADYGGYAPHLPFLASLPAGIDPGRCFPAGHASAGFVLIALYFGLRDDHRHAAVCALVGALLLGFVMGWAQTMRGAHFLSHTLWSAWIVWLVLLGCYLVFPPRALPAKTPAENRLAPAALSQF